MIYLQGNSTKTTGGGGIDDDLSAKIDAIEIYLANMQDELFNRIEAVGGVFANSETTILSGVQDKLSNTENNLINSFSTQISATENNLSNQIGTSNSTLNDLIFELNGLNTKIDYNQSETSMSFSSINQVLLDHLDSMSSTGQQTFDYVYQLFLRP